LTKFAASDLIYQYELTLFTIFY